MKKILFCCMLVGTVLCSCSKSDLDYPVGKDNHMENVPHEMIVLGRKLDDPYTVENMSAAYNSLYPSKSGRKVLEATDLYVRFLPENEEQYDLLESMGVKMIDHPVDYEIITEGDYYHDPELPSDAITWQYSVVPKNFSFPDGIRYELIDECYIADDSKSFDGVDWRAVEEEAFRLTGNGGMISPSSKGSPHTPSGRITIIDDKFASRPIGVSGVMVCCNVFVKIATAYTDANGYYSVGKSFSADVRYRLVFKNVKGFGIGFNFIIVPASVSTLGKTTSEGISVVIDKNSDRNLFCRCVVNNAAYDYFESCSDNGITMATPPGNLRFWLLQAFSSSSAPMLQQGNLIDNSILSDYLGQYLWIVRMFMPDILLGMKGLGSYDEIYAAALHEMAHASHYSQVGKEFWSIYSLFVIKSFIKSWGSQCYGNKSDDNSGYCEVGEMWAYYVQHALYKKRYGENKVFGTGYWFSPQIFINLDSRGIDRFKIFPALNSDVCDIISLQDKLLSLYPEAKSIINQAFGRYN